LPAVASEPIETSVGEMSNVQATPAWVTRKVQPAIVSVPDRELPSGFAATL